MKKYILSLPVLLLGISACLNMVSCRPLPPPPHHHGGDHGPGPAHGPGHGPAMPHHGGPHHGGIRR